MKYYNEEDYFNDMNKKVSEHMLEFGCGFCWDKKRNKNKELFFLDQANNMRVCIFCPHCGRRYKED